MPQYERVLHVLHSMNCAGAENMIMNLYRNIDRNKWQFDFLLNFEGKSFFEDEIENLGGKIYKMPSLRESGPRKYKSNLDDFFRHESKHRIIHSHLETSTGLILTAAKKADKPVRIAHAHNTSHTRIGLKAFPENLYKNFCRAKIKNSATAYFACSKKARDFMFGKESDKCLIIKNAIEGENFRFSDTERRRLREALGVDEKTQLLGHVGRFDEQKNHEFLLEVFKDYLRVNQNSLLCLAGEGPLLEKMKNRAKDLSLADKVLFLGLSGDIGKLMQAMDVFLLPSKFEGLALALIEAQTADLPCLVSNTVTAEADLGQGYMKFLPIDRAGVNMWVKEISKIYLSKKTRKAVKLDSCGYEAKANAKRLEEIYFDLLTRTQSSAPSSLPNYRRV